MFVIFKLYKRITIVLCSTKTYHLFQSTKIKKNFWDTWPRMHGHFIWGVIAMSYPYRNVVKFAVSCYNFLKIAHVVKSYLYPYLYLYLCPCIQAHDAKLAYNWNPIWELIGFSLSFGFKYIYVCVWERESSILLLNYRLC